MTALLGIIAIISFVGMIGDKDPGNRRHLLYAFLATLATIVLLSIVR